jgi:hypothetical protein
MKSAFLIIIIIMLIEEDHYSKSRQEIEPGLSEIPSNNTIWTLHDA